MPIFTASNAIAIPVAFASGTAKQAMIDPIIIISEYTFNRNFTSPNPCIKGNTQKVTDPNTALTNKKKKGYEAGR